MGPEKKSSEVKREFDEEGTGEICYNLMKDFSGNYLKTIESNLENIEEHAKKMKPDLKIKMERVKKLLKMRLEEDFGEHPDEASMKEEKEDCDYIDRYNLLKKKSDTIKEVLKRYESFLATKGANEKSTRLLEVLKSKYNPWRNAAIGGVLGCLIGGGSAAYHFMNNGDIYTKEKSVPKISVSVPHQQDGRVKDLEAKLNDLNEKYDLLRSNEIRFSLAYGGGEGTGKPFLLITGSRPWKKGESKENHSKIYLDSINYLAGFLRTHAKGLTSQTIDDFENGKTNIYFTEDKVIFFKGSNYIPGKTKVEGESKLEGYSKKMSEWADGKRATLE